MTSTYEYRMAQAQEQRREARRYMRRAQTAATCDEAAEAIDMARECTMAAETWEAEAAEVRA